MKRRFGMAVLAAAVVAGAFTNPARPIALAQQPKCLHGPDETPAERELRRQALMSARSINTGESRARSESDKRYRTLGELGGIVMPPDDWDVHLVTDGSAYAFSIKDTRDPCRFTLFSDQHGVIFLGDALR